MLEFDLPKEQSSIIKVIGIGGGGSNAVNYMFEQGIRGVNFVVGNTDNQALEMSPVPNKIQLGPASTEGLGAGSNPEVGKLATEESLEEIRSLLEKNTKMVFVTAGMGGGTGTGGAPVVAELARSMGILTVGICTTPFFFEGRRKIKQADAGIEELRNSVDSLIVISNDKIREIFGNLTRSEAFAKADNILAIAAKSISEIITVPGQINVDFADVEYVMKNSGVSIMGSAIAEGEDRAAKAIQGALSSPLLNDNDIRGAQKILLNITSGTKQMLIDEITEIHEYVQEAAGNDTDVIFGTCDDESLGEKISVTVIATGFERKTLNESYEAKKNNKVVHTLGNAKQETPVQPQSFVREEETPTDMEPVLKREEPKLPETSVNNDTLEEEVKRHVLDWDMPQQEQEEETTEEEPWVAPEEPKQDVSMDFSFSFLTGKTHEENGEFNKLNEAEPEEEEQPTWEAPQQEEISQPFMFNEPVSNYQEEEQEEDLYEEEEEQVEEADSSNSFEFVIRHKEPTGNAQQPQANQDAEDLETIANERVRRLRNLSMKLNNPNNLTELENVPAFKRRNIQLANSTPHSSQQNMSRYSLDEGDEGGELRKNNRFLHDNVD